MHIHNPCVNPTNKRSERLPASLTRFGALARKLCDKIFIKGTHRLKRRFSSVSRWLSFVTNYIPSLNYHVLRL